MEVVLEFTRMHCLDRVPGSRSWGNCPLSGQLNIKNSITLTEPRLMFIEANVLVVPTRA